MSSAPASFTIDNSTTYTTTTIAALAGGGTIRDATASAADRSATASPLQTSVVRSRTPHASEITPARLFSRWYRVALSSFTLPAADAGWIGGPHLDITVDRRELDWRATRIEASSH